ncbi:Negative elongation factor A [Armadillidium nasatum]|uniref:Negative elongation factor A n=1 Tax=Armadillidium nasatum TaxID=96803 RepID=A0A5N5SIG3_9CRUS|nr:Negative elongation factor A [Armadillidium nasatum]
MTHDLISDMKKLVKKHSELGLLPMECNYLNRNAFLAAAGQQVPLTKHFALKRKPKAAALRMDLLNRSSDAQANVKKNQLPSVPVRSRGAPRKSDMTPMKGIPSRISSSGLRTSGLNTTPLSRPLARTNLNRKDGGIKLLEITESPVVVPQVLVVFAKFLIVYSQSFSASPGSTVTLGPLTVRSPLPTASTPSGGRATPIGTPVTITPQRIIVANSQGAGGTQTILYRTVSTTPGGYTHAELVQATPVSIAQGEVVSAPSGQPQYATLQPVQPDMIYTGVNLTTNSLAPNQTTQLIAVTPAAIASNNTSSNNTSNSNSTQVQQPSQVHSTPQPQQQPVQHAQPVQQKRNLSLTKEQMLEAQEMFRTSNKVTRPEKALILGFMAGSRDNPCPHLGNIVTIKLSEREEMVSQPDGSLIKMLAETHFQMNYNSGEWQRIRKYRALPVE